MNTPQSASENLAKGLVLDEKGSWVPLAEKVSSEREFRDHLRRGQVLVDGNWVTIEEAKSRGFHK